MKTIGKIQIHQVLIALIVGIILGFLIQRCQFQNHLGARPNGNIKKQMLKRLSHDLHLTTEQKIKVEAIFEAKQPQMKALREETRPKFEAIHEATQAEIRLILNPDQQEKFEKISARMKERFKKREKRYE